MTGHHKSHLVWLESRRFIRLIIICGHYDQSLQISTWSDITKVIITDFYKSHYDRLYKSHFLWSYGQYKSHYDQSLQMSTWPDIAKSLWSVLQKSLWAIFIKSLWPVLQKSLCAYDGFFSKITMIGKIIQLHITIRNLSFLGVSRWWFNWFIDGFQWVSCLLICRY